MAGFAGIAALGAWSAAAVLEVARSNVGHSLISRPERFFGDATLHWPIAGLVALFAAGGLVAVGGVLAAPRTGRASRTLAGGLLLVALAARVAVALLLPSDPGGYSVSEQAALAANMAVLLMPASMLALAFAGRRTSPFLAWTALGGAVAMAALAPWAEVWSARSGAGEPQLLALEPVECVAACWFGLAGTWLVGPRWPSVRLPSPGRLIAILVPVAIVAVVAAAALPFERDYGTIVSAQLEGRVRVERIHADKVDRTYRVYRPSGVLANPGLVFVLHGAFGGGFQAEQMSGFDAQADRLGWIVVYPDGVADGWDAFGSGPAWGHHPGADDIAFFRAMIARLEATDAVDPDRVYVTGMSRGGMMSYRLGCELSDVVAAIAPVSGNMATASGSVDVPCSPVRPVSVLATHGTADTTIPIGGGKVDIVFSSLADVIARWRSMDGCGGSPAITVSGAETESTWQCAGASTVATRIIDGWCHCWPGDAAAVIADFFLAHPRNAAAT